MNNKIHTNTDNMENTGNIENTEHRGASRQVTVWLFSCAAMVLLMVLVGGLTRLTDSGLSMTGWKPLSGWLPPLSDAQWQNEFAAYQQSPQFKMVNIFFELDEFKNIFWLEYIHRLMGRVTGLLVLLPFMVFLIKKSLPRWLVIRSILFIIMIGIQGIIGWYMVKSGLKNDPYVSHFWLSGHLLFACAILAIILWTAFDTIQFDSLHPRNVSKKYKQTLYLRVINGVCLVVVLQIMWGGFVAGLDAGLIYNSFPDMNGHFFPDSMRSVSSVGISSWIVSFFNDPGIVQWTHRMVAYLVLLVVAIWLYLSWFVTHIQLLKWGNIALFITLLSQIGLGVLTLWYHVPVVIASMHQLMAVIIFAITVYLNYIALRVFGASSGLDG